MWTEEQRARHDPRGRHMSRLPEKSRMAEDPTVLFCSYRLA